jgi:hypothetical protein
VQSHLENGKYQKLLHPRSRLWCYKAHNRAFWGPTTHKCSYKRASKKGNVSWRPTSTLTNLNANYPLRIIVLIKLITPPFTVFCCNDKHLGFDQWRRSGLKSGGDESIARAWNFEKWQKSGGTTCISVPPLQILGDSSPRPPPRDLRPWIWSSFNSASYIVSIINVHSCFDVLCQTVYCVTVTYCVQVSSGKPIFLT